MKEILLQFLVNFKSILSSFSVYDFIDICFIAFILYSVIVFIRQTRAFQLVKGLVVMFAAYLIFDLLEMQATTFLMSRLFKDLVLVVVLVFQPEIRHALESMGRSSRLPFNFFSSRGMRPDDDEYSMAIDAICKACSNMSNKKIGALIVCEKDSLLGEITSTGSRIDAIVSTEMLENIFYPKAPLHDGACIIKGGTITAAGCILPLTDNALSSELGTRHRAAVGMSEKSDAMIVVVSEETGMISVAVEGSLKRGVSVGVLREELSNYFILSQKKDKSFFKRIFRGKKNEENA